MKTISPLALALTVCASAFAQDGVTILGTVDAYVNMAKSGNTRLTRLEDGGNTASRLVFRGSEDLGSGLHANFLMEAGFSSDTGAGTLPGPGLMFTRQSQVGLSGNWGSVDLGRMYTPMFYALYQADAFGLNAVFSPISLVGSTDGQTGLRPFSARANNMVRYRTPSHQALALDVAYSFGEAASPNQRNGDIYGANLSWTSKPYFVAYAFQRTIDGSAAAPVAAPKTSTYQTLSAAYDVSADWRLSANYIRNSLNAPTTPTASISTLGAEWTVGPVSKLMASVVKREVSGSARGQLAWTFGYDYYLSKRTALYARWLQLANRGGASATLAGVPVVANSGDGVRSVALGVRHNF